jgi:hypothetical protein
MSGCVVLSALDTVSQFALDQVLGVPALIVADLHID